MELREVFPDKEELIRLFSRIGVDKDGVEVMIPKAGHRFFYIKDLRAPAANILKQEALSRGLEAAVSIGVINCSVKSTDVLLWGDERRLRLLADKLNAQVYGLDRLSRALSSAMAEKPVRWVARGRELPLGKPGVMGILNVTPDSFYDGGRHRGTATAVEHGLRMASEGALIIDVGGESTRPGAEPVSVQEELDRVIPVVEGLRKNLPSGVFVSVDTYKARVAAEAAGCGADMINDISGLGFDPDMAGVIAENGLGLVLMHIKGTPKNMQKNPFYEDTVEEIYCFLKEKMELAERAGVSREQIAVDPGIGFGKRVYDNLLILKKIREFKSLGRPVVVGHSRKSFIGKIQDAPDPRDRLPGSVAVAALAGFLGADVIRAHDVKETVDALRVAEAVSKPEEYLP